MNSDRLALRLQEIKGVGPKLAGIFSKKGLNTFEDALYFIPRDYEDRRTPRKIRELQVGAAALVRGRVERAGMRAGRKPRFEAILSDGTGSIALNWFHGFPYLERDLGRGQELVVFGEARPFGGILGMVHPDYETLDEGETTASAHFGRVVPVYSECEGASQKVVRKVIGEVLRGVSDTLEDPLPLVLRERLGLPTLKESFSSLHFPNEIPKVGESPWLKRIIFEEFFILQLGLGLRLLGRKEHKAPRLKDEANKLESFLEALPFTLTADQKTVLGELVEDLGKEQAMARLVQGDVGSGKTVVALAACVIAASAGFQSALMVPTEILAQQHFQKASEWFRRLGIRAGLIVQGSPSRAEVQKEMASGRISVVIGTHALFQQAIQFKNLGLVIVDEQHRFGVEQRTELVRKSGGGLTPHLLMMTATPIPRTLALTLYGDLDLSFIRNKPAGRQIITTKVLRDREEPLLYQIIRETVKKGQQVYIIYPLVEESEKLDLKSATQMYERMRREVFPGLRIALLHGRMKGEEKQAILEAFRAGKVDILISTTVVEVGIDVANATLMVIEHPERLGLSQLHQLRGRVGRGEHGGRCILMAKGRVGPRLRIMEQTDDGFEIAEEDLKIRGPGEFLGTRQSGLPGFRVGHLIRDGELLQLARREARAILERDPRLEAPEHGPIAQLVESRWRAKLERLRN